MVCKNLSALNYYIFFGEKKRITKNQSLKELSSPSPQFLSYDPLLIRVTMAGFAGPPPKGSQQYPLYDFGHWAVLLASIGLPHLVALALAFTVFFICV